MTPTSCTTLSCVVSCGVSNGNFYRQQLQYRVGIGVVNPFRHLSGLFNARIGTIRRGALKIYR